MVLYSSVISDGPTLMAATLHLILYSATGRLADNTHNILIDTARNCFNHTTRTMSDVFSNLSVARLDNVTNDWVWLWPSQV